MLPVPVLPPVEAVEVPVPVRPPAEDDAEVPVPVLPLLVGVLPILVLLFANSAR